MPSWVWQKWFMSENPQKPLNPQQIANQQRLEKALRANLHKRKAQARSRVESAAESADDAAGNEEQ